MEVDTLVLPDISADELCFTSIDKDIYITLKGTRFQIFSVQLKAGGSVAEKKTEKVRAGDDEFFLKDLLLSTAISSFSAEEKQQLIRYHTGFVFPENMVQLPGEH